MTSKLAPVFAYAVHIPKARRADVSSVFRLAAEKLLRDAINSRNGAAHAYYALQEAVEEYPIPLPYVMPFFRDVMGLMPLQLDEWDRFTSAMGAMFTLRAFAHAIDHNDL